MVKLSRLVIHRFRQVKPGTTLEFADGFNLILGENGTGKTTLLRLLGAVWSANFRTYEQDDFDVEGFFAGPMGEASLRVAHSPPPDHLSKRNGARRPPVRSWRVSVTRSTGMPALDGSLTVSSAGDVSKEGFGGVGLERGEVSAFDPMGALSFSLDLLDQGIGLFPQFPEVLPGPDLRMDEALEWLGHARGNASLLFPEGANEKVPLRVWLPKVSGQPEAASFGGATWTGASVTFLGQIAEAFSALRVAMNFEVLGGISAQMPESEGRDLKLHSILVTRADGVTFRLEDLSFGQQRMFGMLWYLALMPEAVFIDELANGLHHDWIEAAMKAIGERQAFLATQHPFIMDFLPGFEAPDELRRSIIRCRSVVEEGREVWLWENLPPKEAAEVYQSLEVGIMRLNEVLRARGLW